MRRQTGVGARAASTGSLRLRRFYTYCISLCVSLEDYQRALDAACREWEQLAAERKELDVRLAQLQQTIGTLNKLCGYQATVPWGLTDACRVLLKAAGRPMTAVELRDRLSASGLDLERYANALAAIHTVLKRLVETGEIAPADTDESTRVAYEFLGTGIIASRVMVPSSKKKSGRSRR